MGLLDLLITIGRRVDVLILSYGTSATCVQTQLRPFQVHIDFNLTTIEWLQTSTPSPLVHDSSRTLSTKYTELQNNSIQDPQFRHGTFVQGCATFDLAHPRGAYPDVADRWLDDGVARDGPVLTQHRSHRADTARDSGPRA